MDINRTTARLRRTFHYPADNDDDTSSADGPEVLDEQEQETLITTLSAQNARRNTAFRNLLLALPVLGAAPVLIALFFGPSSSSSSSSRIPAAMLALSSLASTAYLLLRLPVSETGMPVLDAWAAGGGDADASTSGYGHGHGHGHGSGVRLRSRGERDGDHAEEDDDGEDEDENEHGRRVNQRRRGLLQQQQQQQQQGQNLPLPFLSYALSSGPHRSPLERWLPLLNVGLGATALLAGSLAGGNGSSGDGFLSRAGTAALPLLIYVVVLVAKMVMAGVDPERELGALRYGLKGA